MSKKIVLAMIRIQIFSVVCIVAIKLTSLFDYLQINAVSCSDKEVIKDHVIDFFERSSLKMVGDMWILGKLFCFKSHIYIIY